MPLLGRRSTDVPSHEADVAVVGAGLAGIAAARVVERGAPPRCWWRLATASAGGSSRSRSTTGNGSTSAPRGSARHRTGSRRSPARASSVNGAAGPERYLERDWTSEEWSRGCYAGYAPPGVLTAYGPAIRAPIGPIHWAGTETATVWNGYMDGALQSGERAATDALGALVSAAEVEPVGV